LLEGRGVVVTGAGRGLGRAYALAAARESGGIVVNDVDGEVAHGVVEEIRREGGRAIASVASISEWDATAELIAACVREYGSCDGLVNNAVVYSFDHPWDEDPAQTRRQVEVNILGALYCGAHALRQMKNQRRGSIVNVVSDVMMGAVGMSTYAAAKGAMASVTRAWALEMRPHDIRVNAISPGALTRVAKLSGRFGRPDKTDDPLPETIAPAVVFLLSDLSEGITGQLVLRKGRQLGLVGYPGPIEPVLEADEWSSQAIADAFAGVLRAKLQPVGRDPQAAAG
jgi:NAD(P)-dependent dehydrogenase (short-subunit alcohol dehydrogenase family)